MTLQRNLSAATTSFFGKKTKGTILSTSLELFNQSGFHAVSTAQIASASDVLEGTLWYHFKAKQDLAKTHLETLEVRLEESLLLSGTTDPQAVVERYLSIFDTLWDFRYLLRDPLPILQADPDFANRIKHTYKSVEKNTAHRLKMACDEGLLSLCDVDVNALAKNCVVIGRYWLDYIRIRNGCLQNRDSDKRQAAQQVLLVLKPYLTPKALSLIGASPSEILP
ncbi:MAG: TetR/AcrR family transcriptional regulator [Pseudomonadota bacterium]